MSNNIDERIVQMEFNNKQFENGIKTSLKSLDDLKRGLNMEKSARNLTDLQKVANGFSLNSISSNLEKISSKFNALGVVGFTVLQNLTNAATNFGKNIVSALTIDPITTGFEEYETKMGAIQTILTNTASKGTNLDDVTKALNELNEYSDKTIYNFAEMARNIGTFTAAGVDLKTSTTSIKGIANLAAGSGSSSLQASTAMYQLSQAIAAGSVKLMDWNSVVNAGMGGELFQKALEKTAVQLGKGRDMSVSFRESLESGWITTEVLTKTLAKFAEDESLVKAATEVKTFTQLMSTMKESVQSGWSISWENIVGDKNESTKLLTAISDAFGEVTGKSADARNEMLSFWKANGGRAAVLQGIANACIGLSQVLEPIEKAFRDLFPAMTGQRLVEISKGFQDLTANFKIGEETSNRIHRTFKGLFALLDIGRLALSALGNSLMSVIKYLFPVGDGFLSTTASIGDFLVSIDNVLRSSNAFNVGLAKIGSVLKPVADGIKFTIGVIIDAFKSMGKIDTSGLDSFSEKVRARFEPFTKSGGLVKTAFDKIFGVMIKASPILNKISEVIGKAFYNIQQGIVKAFDNSDFQSVFDVINGGLFAAILLGLKKFIGSLTNITDNTGGFIGQFKGILDGVKGSLEAFQSQLKATVLRNIAVAIGILAASLLVLSLIDSKKLTLSLAAMTTMFIQLFGSMAVFEKLMGSAGFASMGKITLSMIALSTAMLILSFAVSKMSNLDWQGLAKGLVGVAGLAGILVGSAKLLENSSGSFIRGSLGLILFGAALNIMVGAVTKLGKLNIETLSKGLIGVGVLVTELALFMKTTDLSGMGVLKGLGLIALAVALNILATAVEKFAEINVAGMVKGLVAVGVVLGELAIFTRLTGNSTNVLSTAIGLTVLGAAMLVFSKAIGLMGSLSWESIGKGLITMAGALAVITVAMNFMPSNMIITGLGLVAVAGALLILSNALSNMGGMSWEGIAKGLVTLAGSLTIIAIAMAFMTTALPGAAALLIVAGALAILAPVLKLMGGMALSEIGKGLLAMAGVFSVVGVAGLVLAPLTPIILSLSAAIALFGLGCIAVGAGVMAFATGLGMLAVSGVAGAAALVVIMTTLLNIVPLIVKTFAKGIIDFIRVLGEGAKTIAQAVKSIISESIKMLMELTPLIVESLFTLLEYLLKTLIKYIPTIVDAAVKLVIAFAKGIRDNIGEIISIAIQIVINFIEGVASKIDDVIQAGIDLIISFINGVADGIRNNTDQMNAAMNNLMDAMITAGLKALDNSISKFTEVGKNIVHGLINGIKSMISDVANSASNLGSSVLNSAKKALGIHSPSKFFKEIGNNIGAGLTNGINDSTKNAVQASTNMSEQTTKASSDVVKKSNTAAKSAFDSATEWIDERKYYDQLSLKEELQAWQNVQAKYKEGTEERKKIDREVYRVKKEIVKADEETVKMAEENKQKAYKKTYEDSLNWIDDQKYYDKMSLTDELAAWERVQSRYLEGTEERKRADREVYRLKKEIAKDNEDSLKASTEKMDQLYKDEFNSAVESIDERKYYNQMSLTEELALWEQLQERYVQGSEERKRADKEVYQIRKQIQDTDKEYTQKVLDVEKEANDKRIQLEQEYYNKTKEINDKLTQDIKSATDEYNKAIESRTNTLYNSYGLFDKVSELEKVSGTDLITNLKDQVKQFEMWSQNINELASKGVSDGLIKELQDMGPKSLAQIQALNKMDNSELGTYVDLWRTKHNEAKTQAISELESLRIETANKIQQLNTDAQTALKEYRLTWSDQMTALTTETDTKLTTLKTEWMAKIGSLRTDTEKEFITLTDNVQKEVNKPNWSELGGNIVRGMTVGVQNKAKDLANAAAVTALMALNAAKAALGIQSPSREFAKVGMYSVLGMVKGIQDNSSKVITSVKQVGTNAINTLKDSLSNMSGVIESEITDPVIRPVLDLTNIKNRMSSVNGLFANQTINTGGISAKVPDVKTGSDGVNGQNGSEIQKTSTISFTQINNSPKELSRLEIYRQTKNQINMLKGLTPA